MLFWTANENAPAHASTSNWIDEPPAVVSPEEKPKKVKKHTLKNAYKKSKRTVKSIFSKEDPDIRKDESAWDTGIRLMAEKQARKSLNNSQSSLNKNVNYITANENAPAHASTSNWIDEPPAVVSSEEKPKKVKKHTLKNAYKKIKRTVKSIFSKEDPDIRKGESAWDTAIRLMADKEARKSLNNSQFSLNKNVNYITANENAPAHASTSNWIDEPPAVVSTEENPKKVKKHTLKNAYKKSKRTVKSIFSKEDPDIRKGESAWDTAIRLMADKEARKSLNNSQSSLNKNVNYITANENAPAHASTSNWIDEPPAVVSTEENPKKVKKHTLKNAYKKSKRCIRRESS